MNLSRGNEIFSVTYFKTETKVSEQWLNPYLDEKWKPGYMVFSDSIQWFGQLRFDLFRKEMEMIFKSDTVYISDPFEVDLVDIDGKKFIYSLFFTSGNDQSFGSDYFEMLSKDGRAKLLLRRELRVDESKGAPGNMLLGNEVETKTQFAQIYTYFIQQNKGTQAVQIKRKKRFVLEALGSNQKEIKDFAKNNKLGFKKTTHLVQIVDYFNTIPLSSE